MRIILTVVMVFFTYTAKAQTVFEGIDLSETEEITETWTALNDYLYSKDLYGENFSSVVYETESGRFHFVNRNPTGMRFSRILDQLHRQFGEHTVDNDYIPAGAEDNYEYLAILVEQEKAEISRFWDIIDSEYGAMLQWSPGSITVTFGKK